MPGMGLRGPVGTQMHYLANLGRGQQLSSDVGFSGPSANEVYVQQQAMPPAYPNYATTGAQSQMGPPLTDGMITSQTYSNQQSPISPQFSSSSSHQPSPMQSMASALQSNPQTTQSILQTPFGANVFDVNDPMQYNFDPSSFNFGNHYGALEFGMLGQMSSGAMETPPTESTAQMSQAISASYPTPGTISSTGFTGSPSNAQSYFYPQDQGLAECRITSIRLSRRPNSTKGATTRMLHRSALPSTKHRMHTRSVHRATSQAQATHQARRTPPTPTGALSQAHTCKIAQISEGTHHQSSPPQVILHPNLRSEHVIRLPSTRALSSPTRIRMASIA